MARRLILDTGVLVMSGRGHGALAAVIGADDDVAVAAITVAELLAGVELATEAHRQGRREFVAKVLETLPVEVYDLPTAQQHGKLLAHAQRTGRRRGAHDLVVAATAAATRRTIVTTDRRARFGDLPGVACLEVGPLASRPEATPGEPS